MRYLIAVIDSRTGTASSDEIAAIDAFNDRLRDGGHWVMAVGIESPSAAVVIDNRNGAMEISQGPLNDTAEYMAGFWIVDAESDAVAQALAAEGSKACNRKVEVRKFHGA